jgi:hypothetical protein
MQAQSQRNKSLRKQYYSVHLEYSYYDCSRIQREIKSNSTLKQKYLPLTKGIL